MGEEFKTLPDMLGKIRIQCSDRRHGIPAERSVADAHQGNLFRNPDTVFIESRQSSLGKFVIQCDQRRETLVSRQCPADRLKGVFNRLRTGRHFGRQLRRSFGNGAPDCNLDIFDRMSRVVVQQSDTPVTERMQMIGDQPDSMIVISDDRRDAELIEAVREHGEKPAAAGDFPPYFARIPSMYFIFAYFDSY